MAEKRLECVVISSDRTLAAKAARLMRDEQRGLHLAAQYASPLTEIGKAQADEIRNCGAQLILLDLGDDPAVGLRLARYLADDSPGSTFVLTGPTVAPEILLEAMRLGASEYLTRPVDDADLAAALARAARRLAGTELREVAPFGRVVVMYSAKGGSGVTTTAANTAVALAQTSGKPTLLVDLDLELGGTALLLGLRPRYSVLDVVRNLHRLDRDLLTSYVEMHEAGLSVLASPADPAPKEGISREQARAMLQFLRRQFDSVVIDVGHSLTPITLAALESADDVLVLTTPDVVSLNNTKRVLPLIERAAGDPKRVRIVVNRRRAADAITAADIQRALEREVYSILTRDDDAVIESLNTGKPVVRRRHSRYGRDIRSLVAQLIGTPSSNGRTARASEKKPRRPWRPFRHNDS